MHTYEVYKHKSKENTDYNIMVDISCYLETDNNKVLKLT